MNSFTLLPGEADSGQNHPDPASAHALSASASLPAHSGSPAVPEGATMAPGSSPTVLPPSFLAYSSASAALPPLFVASELSSPDAFPEAPRSSAVSPFLSASSDGLQAAMKKKQSDDWERKRSERQVENATKVFLDMRFSSNFEEPDKCEEQTALLKQSTGRSVSDILNDQRACEEPSYKNHTELGVPCVCTCVCIGTFNALRTCLCASAANGTKQLKNQICLGLKFDIFSLMCLIALVQQGQNNFSDVISTASFCFTLTFEFLICIICLSEYWPQIRNCFPKWILSTKQATEMRSEVQPHPQFSPFAPVLWEYSVPFLVYFQKTFSSERRVFNHKMPAAFSPAVLFTRSAANILVIISTIIFRFAGMSFNSKMFNLPEPRWNLPFNPNPTLWGVATEVGICDAVAVPKLTYMYSGAIQYNHEIIHTPMLLNLFIVFFMALSVKSFSLSRKSIEALQNVGHELKRHKLKYHNGGANEENAYSLWLTINDCWVEDMVSRNDDFLSQIMGFQDVELDHSSGTLKPAEKKSAPAKRFFFLSLIPLLLASIIPVSYASSKNPALSWKLGIPCPTEQPCLNLFSASVMGRCNAASNTTVWYGDYYSGCIKCDILIRGSFNEPAYYFIQIFTTVANFLETHVAVHCAGLVMTAPFFMITKRMESLLRTIDRTSCIQSIHYAPLIPLCNGDQIASWLALFKYERTIMKLKFSENSLPLGALFLTILIVGAIMVAATILRWNIIVIVTFASYLAMAATFFLLTFASAATVTSKQDDLMVKVRDQQVTFTIYGLSEGSDNEVSAGVADSKDRIPTDSNISERLESMIGYLETNSGTLKLLKIIPANFTTLTLIGGYAGTAFVTIATYLGATFPQN